jgi:uncharacterized protein YkwD
MKSLRGIILAVGCVLLAACAPSLESAVSFDSSPTLNKGQITISRTPVLYKDTLTPFLPVENTSTYTPSASQTASLTPTITETLTQTPSLTSTWTASTTMTSIVTSPPTISNTDRIIHHPTTTKIPTRTRTQTVTMNLVQEGGSIIIQPTQGEAAPSFTLTVVSMSPQILFPTPSATVFMSTTESVLSISPSTETVSPSLTATPIFNSPETNPGSSTPSITSTPLLVASPTYTPTFTIIPPSTSTRIPTPTFTAVTGCSPTFNTNLESQVVALINQERINNGLPPLTLQAALTSAARGHSQDMACNNFFSHTGSDGSTSRDRIARQGYSASWAGENIYGGMMSSPTVVVTWWMNSAPHRANILNINYTSFGVGYVYVSTAPYQKYWTVNFARP